MIVAYELQPQDGKADYFSAADVARFACQQCSTILDDSFVPSRLRPKRNHDVWGSYDRRLIVSARFVHWANEHASHGVLFDPIGSDGKWFRLRCTHIIEVDTEKSETEIHPLCTHCGRRTGAYQKKPIVLRNVTSPLPLGLYWTDICFGGGREQAPQLLFSPDAKESIEQFGVKSLLFEPVYSSDHKFAARPPKSRTT
jgi:hypothetical protein